MSSLKRLYRKPDTPWAHTTNTERMPEIYFVFDGLDEIPYGNSRSEILELLSEISSLSTAEHIHLLVTSRNEMDISNILKVSQGWQHYEIQDSRVEDDIALYTSSQIAAHQRLNRLPNRVKDMIKLRLIDGANGM